MKKIIISLIFLVSVIASFGQSGSLSQSVYRSRVNDSTSVTTPAGYGLLYYNNQRPDPKWLFSNDQGATWQELGSGSGGTALTDGNLTTANGSAVDLGGTQTGDINFDYGGFNTTGSGDYLGWTQQDNTGGFGFPLWGRSITGNNDAIIADSVDGTTRRGITKITAEAIEHFIEHKSTGEVDMIQATGGDASLIHIDASSNQTKLGVQDGGFVVQVEGSTGSDDDVIKKVGGVWTLAPDAGGSGTVDGSGTTNELPFWVDSNTLGSLTTATYPSLSELTTVKGVTSSIQTQLNAKSPIASPTFTGTVTIPNGGVFNTPTSATLTNATGYLLNNIANPTGTTTLALSTNPLIFTSGVTTGTGATSGIQNTFNSLTTGNGFDISSSSLTTGAIAKITSTTTAINHTAGSNGLLSVISSGANANSARTTVGINSVVTNTGTTSVNYAGYFSASGASTNYDVVFANNFLVGNARANTIGTNNLFFGNGAGNLSIAAGNRNIGIGTNTFTAANNLVRSVAVGYEAGKAAVNSLDNVFIGVINCNRSSIWNGYCNISDMFKTI